MAAENKTSAAVASIITQVVLGVGGTAAIYNLIDDRLEKLESRWMQREEAHRRDVRDEMGELKIELSRVRDLAYRARGIN